MRGQPVSTQGPTRTWVQVSRRACSWEVSWEMRWCRCYTSAWERLLAASAASLPSVSSATACPCRSCSLTCTWATCQVLCMPSGPGLPTCQVHTSKCPAPSQGLLCMTVAQSMGRTRPSISLSFLAWSASSLTACSFQVPCALEMSSISTAYTSTVPCTPTRITSSSSWCPAATSVAQSASTVLMHCPAHRCAAPGASRMAFLVCCERQWPRWLPTPGCAVLCTGVHCAVCHAAPHVCCQRAHLQLLLLLLQPLDARLQARDLLLQGRIAAWLAAALSSRRAPIAGRSMALCLPHTAPFSCRAPSHARLAGSSGVRSDAASHR